MAPLLTAPNSLFIFGGSNEDQLFIVQKEYDEKLQKFSDLAVTFTRHALLRV